MEGAETKTQESNRKDRSLEVEYKSSLVGSQEIVTTSGISFRLWRLYAYF